MTTAPPTITEFGVMSPLTLLQRIAYGTLCTGARGVISASVPTVIPMYRTDPSSTAPDVESSNGATLPRSMEK